MSINRSSEILRRDASLLPDKTALERLSDHAVAVSSDAASTFARSGLSLAEVEAQCAESVATVFGALDQIAAAADSSANELSAEIAAADSECGNLERRLGVPTAAGDTSLTLRAQLQERQCRASELGATATKHAQHLAIVKAWQDYDLAKLCAELPAATASATAVSGDSDLSATSINAQAEVVSAALRHAHGVMMTNVASRRAHLDALVPATTAAASDIAADPSESFVRIESAVEAETACADGMRRFCESFAQTEATMAATKHDVAHLPQSLQELYNAPSPRPLQDLVEAEIAAVHFRTRDTKASLVAAAAAKLGALYARMGELTGDATFSVTPARVSEVLQRSSDASVGPVMQCQLLTAASAVIAEEIGHAERHVGRIGDVMPLIVQHDALRQRKEAAASSAKVALTSRSANSAHVQKQRQQLEKELPEVQRRILAALPALEVAPFKAFIFKGLILRDVVAPIPPTARVGTTFGRKLSRTPATGQ